MLYYSDGGPGPARKLLRVDAPEDCNMAQWRAAPADAWGPKRGWLPYSDAQSDILWLGEFFMIDASQVEKVQGEIQARYEEFHGAK